MIIIKSLTNLYTNDEIQNIFNSLRPHGKYGAILQYLGTRIKMLYL